MTKDEFEAGYAMRSGVSIEWLHQHGQHAVLCDCGEHGCNGWAMARRDTKESQATDAQHGKVDMLKAARSTVAENVGRNFAVGRTRKGARTNDG